MPPMSVAEALQATSLREPLTVATPHVPDATATVAPHESNAVPDAESPISEVADTRATAELRNDRTPRAPVLLARYDSPEYLRARARRARPLDVARAVDAHWKSLSHLAPFATPRAAAGVAVSVLLLWFMSAVLRALSRIAHAVEALHVA